MSLTETCFYSRLYGMKKKYLEHQMLGWGLICPSKPAYYIVDSRILELVVWTKDNFSGSYSRLSFLFSGFFYFEVFCRTYLLTRYDLFSNFSANFAQKIHDFLHHFTFVLKVLYLTEKKKKDAEKKCTTALQPVLVK